MDELGRLSYPQHARRGLTRALEYVELRPATSRLIPYPVCRPSDCWRTSSDRA
jgi:hypothetical protein